MKRRISSTVDGTGACERHPRYWARLCPSCGVALNVARQEVIAQARALVGWPFAYRGRSETGIDCSGAIVLPGQRAGLGIVDLAYYPDEFCGDPFVAAVAAQFDRVDGDPRPGDVALVLMGSTPAHLLLLTERGTAIHANKKAGAVTENSFDERWWLRLHSLWSYRGIDAEAPA